MRTLIGCAFKPDFPLSELQALPCGLEAELKARL